jgi:hypothetical protein
MLDRRMVNNMRLLTLQIAQVAIREHLGSERVIRNLSFRENDQRREQKDKLFKPGTVFVELSACVDGGAKFTSTSQFWRNEEGWHLGEVDLRYGPEREFFLRQPALVQTPDGTRYIDLYKRGVEGEPIFWQRLKDKGHQEIWVIDLLNAQPVHPEPVYPEVDLEEVEGGDAATSIIKGAVGMSIYFANTFSGLRFVLDDSSDPDKRTRVEILPKSEVVFRADLRSSSSAIRLVGARKAVITEWHTVDVLGSGKLEMGFEWLGGARCKITRVPEQDNI